jgi:hypothetical protein
VHEAVGERAVVREQERPGRVRVEAADRDDAARVPDEPDDGRATVGVARRRHHPGRLVEQDVGERLGLEQRAVELDPVAGLHERREARKLAVHAHPPGPDELLGAAAGGDSCPRQVGVQAHAGDYPRVRPTPPRRLEPGSG